MKQKLYPALIAISLAVLMSSTASCGTIVRQEPASTTEPPTPPPTINSFTATPASLTTGQSTTLSWNVSGATTVTIEPAIGKSGSSGSLTLTPSVSTTYTLTAVNEAGSTTSSVSVSVTPVIAGKPDLVITDIWLVGSLVNYKIANIGSGDAKSSQSYFYVNTVKQASDWVEPLAAGQERTTSFPNFEWKIQTGADVVSGEFSGQDVKACADVDNAIEESNEGNNCLTIGWRESTVYDFVQNAHLAEWRSGAAVFTWPKFAGSKQGAAYLEGKALIMCPEELSNGWVQGRFADYYHDTSANIMRSKLLEVPENARFTAQVGFNTVSASAGGVVVALGYIGEAGGVVLFPAMELHPGDSSRVYNVDLSYLGGKKTEFVLRVEAQNPQAGNCVRWVEPRITRE